LKKSISFQVLIFILIRTILNTGLRMIYPFLPVFSRGLGVDITTLSKAVTLRSASGIAGPLLAAVADVRGRKTGLIMGLLVFTAGMGAMALWPGYAAFVVMLVFSLLGVLIFLPAMQAYLGDRTPYNRRATVIALTELSWSFAFIFGIPLVGFLIARGDWTSPFFLLTAFGGIAVALIFWMIGSDVPKPGTWHPVFKNFGLVFTSIPAVAGIVIGMASSGSNELVNLMFGVWLEDSFGVKIAALSAAAVIIGISELSGEALVTGFTDRIGKERAIAVGLTLNCIVVILLPIMGISLNGALVGLFMFYLTFEFTIVSTIPLMTEILPAARATMMAVYMAGTAVGRSVGDLAAPYLYNLSFLRGQNSGMASVAVAAVALNIVALAALLVVRRNTAPDSGIR
jgi:predicted MFS family arabinose efflux permease